jgi:hypothetical protein
MVPLTLIDQCDQRARIDNDRLLHLPKPRMYFGLVARSGGPSIDRSIGRSR